MNFGCDPAAPHPLRVVAFEPHPENYGAMYPVTFEQDTEYQRLYGLSDKHAQFDAHVNQAQQLTGLPWQAD